MWLTLLILAFAILFLCTKGALELTQASIRRGSIGFRAMTAASSVVVLLGAAIIFAFVVFLGWIGRP
jgi:hypothetical protein